VKISSPAGGKRGARLYELKEERKASSFFYLSKKQERSVRSRVLKRGGRFDVATK